MAKAPVNRETAMGVVADSLGLTADDLGMDRDDTFSDLDLEGDEGDDNDESDAGDDDTNISRSQQQSDDEGDDEDPLAQPRQRQEQEEQRQPNQPDNLRVTHTEKDGTYTGKLKTDAKGNILDQTGKRVIAKAGREARYFTSLHNTKQQLLTVQDTARNAITQTRGKLDKAVEIGTNLANQLAALREVGTAHTRAGISDQEHTQALELASMYKRSPVEAIKLMLTRAAVSGIDMTTLGLQPGGFDPKSLLDLVRSEIGNVTQPIVERNQAETAQQRASREADEAKTAATEEFSQFLVENPEAKNYLHVFEGVYANPKYANMPLNEVWLRIQLQAARGQQPPRPRNRQQPRLPNGRQNPPNGRQPSRQQADEIAPVSDSYDDIVRSVLPRNS